MGMLHLIILIRQAIVVAVSLSAAHKHRIVKHKVRIILCLRSKSVHDSSLFVEVLFDYTDCL